MKSAAFVLVFVCAAAAFVLTQRDRGSQEPPNAASSANVREPARTPAAARAPADNSAENDAARRAFEQLQAQTKGALLTAAAQAKAQADLPSAEEDAQALARMRQGIEAQPREVQKRYYQAYLETGPRVQAALQAEIERLQQAGASNGERVAELRERLSVQQAQLADYEARLAQLQ